MIFVIPAMPSGTLHANRANVPTTGSRIFASIILSQLEKKQAMAGNIFVPVGLDIAFL